MKLRYQNSYSSDVGEFAVKKRTKKKINSILAIFMSLAIIASGFGTPMAGLMQLKMLQRSLLTSFLMKIILIQGSLWYLSKQMCI